MGNVLRAKPKDLDGSTVPAHVPVTQLPEGTVFVMDRQTQGFHRGNNVNSAVFVPAVTGAQRFSVVAALRNVLVSQPSPFSLLL